MAGTRYFTTGNWSHDSPTQQYPSPLAPDQSLPTAQQQLSPAPGYWLPAAIVLTDDDGEASVKCGSMTVTRLRQKLAEYHVDPASRIPLSENGRIDEIDGRKIVERFLLHGTGRSVVGLDSSSPTTHDEDAVMTTHVIKQWEYLERWLKEFIEKNVDFSTVYAWSCIRGWWDVESVTLPDEMDTTETDDQRIGELEGPSGTLERVIYSATEVKFRRIWDVCANKVIPYRWLYSNSVPTPPYWAISHAWTADMVPNWTDVNSRLWPVPLPRGVTLDDIRNELLSLNTRYCWLDVLCLRQYNPESAEGEKCRLQEWQIDVPTIGLVYARAQKVVTYFNGLGRTFEPEKWDDSTKHWSNRAWTLQETVIREHMILGGLPRELKENPFAVQVSEVIKWDELELPPL